LLCGSASAAALDRNAFTFTHYDLTARLAPEESGFAARGTIALRNDSNLPQRIASLQISSTLDWRIIESGGKVLQFLSDDYTTDIDHTGAVREAIVTLPHEVAPHATIELEVGYSGTIPADATRLTRIGTPETTALRNDWDQISTAFTAVRGIGYVCWYPVAMDAADLTDNASYFDALAAWKQRHAHSSMKLSLAVEAGEADASPAAPSAGPSPPFFATSGRLIAERAQAASSAEGAEIRQSVFEFDPFGQTVPVFALGKYELLDRSEAQVSYIPEHKNVAADYALAAEKALPLISEWFGAPQAKARVIELADANAAPFEDGALLFTPLTPQSPDSLQLTMAHQLTHAAFASDRPWIEEGLAHFAQALMRERQNGRPAALEWMGSFLPALRSAENAIPHPLVTSTDAVLYRVKAMFVWWMLRDMLGDNALQKALASYRSIDDTEPSYVQRLISHESKRDMEWFFDDWVYRDRGLPDFHIASASPRPLLPNGVSVAVTVENTAQAGAEVPVLVKAENGGDAVKRVLVRGKSQATERVQIGAQPIEVIVDDGSVPTMRPSPTEKLK
jgi:hypothetical protein